MIIGYMRPYEGDINCKNQELSLQKIPCDTIIKEEHGSAKKRVQLANLIDSLLANDQLVVKRFFTLADSTRHLLELLEAIQEKGAYVQFLDEDIDTSSSNGKVFIHTVKHLLDFQSDVISERTKQGVSRAKKKGISTGRPRKPDENVKKAIEMYQSKNYTLADIKEKTGISKSTLYRYLEG
ncbi:recombinase family protein [Priestia flexa]|jgi:DNA invertase Pin-like site-specific DNA recombinase|uniref:recombinase family protein n=1 Tax=Priestia flexa TaxID=86664 RepID=UPI0009564B74|nr:recombinase family protein [Priestia flexa]MBY6087513.1 recombinase family protein [Priestia flexa]MCM3066212.1 recombinase family protein [Priestia flexa]SIQ49610.1 Site-specific DNA recombinase [Priestia flexa]